MRNTNGTFGQKPRKLAHLGTVIALTTVMLWGCGNAGQSAKPDALSGTDSSAAVSAPYAKESTVEDFEWKINTQTGGCILTNFRGHAQNIIVPPTLGGKTVDTIGTEAFKNVVCESITLPDGVTDIRPFAFCACSMRTIQLGTGIKNVSGEAFSECPNLESLSFPQGTEILDTMAVYRCEALKTVYVPDTVKTTEPLSGIPISCPNAVIVTPVGSAVYMNARIQRVPVRADGGDYAWQQLAGAEAKALFSDICRADASAYVTEADGEKLGQEVYARAKIALSEDGYHRFDEELRGLLGQAGDLVWEKHWNNEDEPLPEFPEGENWACTVLADWASHLDVRYVYNIAGKYGENTKPFVVFMTDRELLAFRATES